MRKKSAKRPLEKKIPDYPEKSLPVRTNIIKPVFGGGVPKKNEAAMPVDTLAADLGVSRPILAGLKTAYRWKSSTRIKKSEFARKMKTWLGASAGGK